MEAEIGPEDDFLLSEEVLSLCSKTSDKFVPAVKKNMILKDTLVYGGKEYSCTEEIGEGPSDE